MTDIKATIHWEDAVGRLRKLDRAGDRATMFALRATGRKVKQTAAREAPVYHGPARMVTYAGTTVPMEPKQLKRSIHSSKQIRREAGVLTLTVSPHGYARFYAKQQEERVGFMRKGYDAGAAIMVAEHEKALKHVIEQAMK